MEIKHMEIDQIIKAFKIAIDVFMDKDEYLINNDLSERCIIHMLALRLYETKMFFIVENKPKYLLDIDCEYNRIDLDYKSYQYRDFIINYKERIKTYLNDKKNISKKLLNKIIDIIENSNTFSDLELKIENNISNKKILKYIREKVIRKVYPDIIIHKRGCEKNNILALEAKKNSNNNSYDIEKIKAYISQLGYQYGFILIIPENSNGKFKITVYSKNKLSLEDNSSFINWSSELI